MNTSLADVLDAGPHLRRLLFCKGFLITDAEIGGAEGFPFYGNWTVRRFGRYFVHLHGETRLSVRSAGGSDYLLIGHAYDPYAMESDEDAILGRIAAAWEAGGGRPDVVDDLTGVFLLARISGPSVVLETDCSGMQYACYGKVGGSFHVASHMQLPGDLLGLGIDGYVDRLVHYRWYRYMMGNYLPGDLTRFREFRRIVPNTSVSYDGREARISRFYPSRPVGGCATEAEYRDVVARAADVLRRTMRLIPEKWGRPAISLTGGIDSNTTFAAANGSYDRYTAFSYVSMPREEVDALAAERIAARFGVPFRRYDVPASGDEVADLDACRRIFLHDDGDIGGTRDDDVRKKVTLIRSDVCDVEVKSWVSETVRAYAYKYFGRTSMPRILTPRHYTSLYKIFCLDRRLVRETDLRFEDYLARTDLKAHLFDRDESDLFVWEMMHGGKCGLNMGVMRCCFEVTIPYNNRRLLDLLLRVPLDRRLSDRHHLDMKRILNPDLADMNVRVVNLNETRARKLVANAYFTINSHLPF